MRLIIDGYSRDLETLRGELIRFLRTRADLGIMSTPG